MEQIVRHFVMSVAIFSLASGLFVFGLAVGSRRATEIERRKAIENNVGEWVIDAQTGSRVFVYGEPDTR